VSAAFSASKCASIKRSISSGFIVRSPFLFAHLV
jgi:hypothetical protein